MPSTWAFMVVWGLIVTTMALMAIIGMRINRLRRAGRAPGAPDWFHPANSLRIVSYVFSDAYKQTGDALLRRLIPLVRACYVLIPVLAVALLLVIRARA